MLALVHRGLDPASRGVGSLGCVCVRPIYATDLVRLGINEFLFVSISKLGSLLVLLFVFGKHVVCLIFMVGNYIISFIKQC